MTEPKGRGADWAEPKGCRPRLDRGAERQGKERPSGHPGGSEQYCVTCSDTAVTVTVTELLPDGLALVDTGSGQEEVSVALVTAVVGDTILVHAGEAIAVVPA